MADATFAQHSFSGHDTFPFRYAWLKKAVDAIEKDGSLFQKDEAVGILGVGKNMVRAIRHWALGTGVLEEDRSDPTSRGGSCRVTELGWRLFGEAGWDPYLEDLGTLWLLHWLIASNPRRCTTWYWAFTMYHEPEFTREAFGDGLFRWASGLDGKPVAQSSVKRDADCFFRTYLPSRAGKGVVLEDTIDCPLVELDLLKASPDGRTYRFARGPKHSLPDSVLLYAVIRFWNERPLLASTLSLFDIARLPGSPGQVFKLDEDSLAERLERFDNLTDGSLGYGETAGLKQLYRRRALDPLTVLGGAFERLPSLDGGLF